MAYIPQFQTTDTIAVSSSLLSGATSCTITNGNFGSPTGTQIYVVDYGIPGTAEIISATVVGTAVTSITRGLPGGAGSTTNHLAGASFGSLWVPQFLGNGLGAIASNDPWIAWTPTASGWVTPTFTQCAYVQVGKTVTVRFSISGTSNATTSSFTLPFASKYQLNIVGSRLTDNGSTSTTIGLIQPAAASTTVLLYKDMTGTGWTASGTKNIEGSFTYESV